MPALTATLPAEARESPGLSRRTALAAGLVALLVPLVFALYSGEVWEDYYITFRSSRHLAEGAGLVYQPGERVHTFTSPLGVLVPALGLRATGSDAGALWFLRLASAACLAATALLVTAHAREAGWKTPAWLLALGLGVIEAKIVAFSANGMETGLLVFFTALCWRELTRPRGPGWRPLLLAYAGLMWTRPDAFVVAGALTAASALFRTDAGPAAPSGAGWWRPVVQAMLLGGLLYAGWFFWAWWYYGSPVPQTILAKAALSPAGFSLARIAATPLQILTSITALDGTFTPIYAIGGGWPPDLMSAYALLARVGAFLWLLPFLPRSTRIASLAFLVGGVYLRQILTFPWYYGPWTFLGAMALAGGVQHGVNRLTQPLHRTLGRMAVLLVLLGGITLLGAQAFTARMQQELVEEAGRKNIGQWLRANAAASDTVFLEPIGYVGYFSRLRILDYPGLTSREVAGLIRGGKRKYAEVIDALQPTWVVLRPGEMTREFPDPMVLLQHYSVVRTWDQRAAIDALPILPGRHWLEFDAEFILLHRRTFGPATVPLVQPAR